MTAPVRDPRRAFDAAMAGEVPLVVYHWRAWEDFLIQRVVPDALAVEASVTDSPQRVFEALPGEAGCVLFHMDCSLTGRFPLQRTALISGLEKRGWIPVNAGVVDISKRFIQSWLEARGFHSVGATRDGAPDEIVVVKSNYNYGGKSERALTPEERDALGLYATPEKWMGADAYRAVPRAEVEPSWWDDESLTVERFVGNTDQVYFRAFVAGSLVHLVRLHNPDRIKKVGKSRVDGSWSADFEPRHLADATASRILAEVQGVSDGFGLHFGSLDVMVDDHGVPHVVDINTTPYHNVHTPIPGLLEHFSRTGAEPPSAPQETP